MKQNNNTKKQDETRKINNGLQSLILRYEGVQGWYIGKVNEYLLENHNKVFLKGDISRIVNDKVRLSPRWIVLKDACEFVVTQWGRQIGDLKFNEGLISTPQGVKVIKVKRFNMVADLQPEDIEVLQEPQPA